jgi:hypothetical protein
VSHRCAIRFDVALRIIEGGPHRGQRGQVHNRIAVDQRPALPEIDGQVVRHQMGNIFFRREEAHADHGMVVTREFLH